GESAQPATVDVELGPITGMSGDKRTVVIDSASRRNVTWYDVQDGHEHHVRGLSLGELIATVKPPKAADTIIFTYKDGMEIPVRLRDREEVKSIFLALGHGDAMERQYADTYPLLNAAELPCPKVVYGRRASTYSIWRYPTALATVPF